VHDGGNGVGGLWWLGLLLLWGGFRRRRKHS
jgi:MYXO-CTERM domain-containing protein